MDRRKFLALGAMAAGATALPAQRLLSEPSADLYRYTFGIDPVAEPVHSILRQSSRTVSYPTGVFKNPEGGRVSVPFFKLQSKFFPVSNEEGGLQRAGIEACQDLGQKEDEHFFNFIRTVVPYQSSLEEYRFVDSDDYMTFKGRGILPGVVPSTFIASREVFDYPLQSEFVGRCIGWGLKETPGWFISENLNTEGLFGAPLVVIGRRTPEAVANNPLELDVVLNVRKPPTFHACYTVNREFAGQVETEIFATEEIGIALNHNYVRMVVFSTDYSEDVPRASTPSIAPTLRSSAWVVGDV